VKKVKATFTKMKKVQTKTKTLKIALRDTCYRFFSTEWIDTNGRKNIVDRESEKCGGFAEDAGRTNWHLLLRNSLFLAMANHRYCYAERGSVARQSIEYKLRDGWRLRLITPWCSRPEFCNPHRVRKWIK